ncbi:DUF3102 domain-containing protein [bacterium]|nr:DUF3102 domain-containing protein [bacterium]
MTELQRLELRVLELVGSINLRPTLDRAAELGEVLVTAKGSVEHGQWLPWLKRVGLNDRSARDYMTVFREVGNRQPAANMTIKQFLVYLRETRINGKRAEREQVRAEVAGRLGKLPESLTLVHKDCRKYAWPVLDAVVTDPPWASMECYRWLATMAADKLRDGGVMLLQVGTGYMADVLRIVTDAGLTYRWTLAVVYAEMRRAKPTAGRYLSAWVPILLFSKGEFPKGDAIGDVYTVRKEREGKQLHDWQQPVVEPLKYWLARLVVPGSLVGDPFAGSGTTGVVCRELALRWVATEKDHKAYEVARGRLIGDSSRTS